MPRDRNTAAGAPRKRLLFVNQHYYPDVAATGQYLADLAEYLAAGGHDVHILCSNGRYEEGQLVAPPRETRHGVHIRRLATTGFTRSGRVGRLTNYLGFFLQVILHLLFARRYDQVVFLTTPPLLALAGLPARLLRRQPYGIWSMDLHPEAEAAIGADYGTGLAVVDRCPPDDRGRALGRPARAGHQEEVSDAACGRLPYRRKLDPVRGWRRIKRGAGFDTPHAALGYRRDRSRQPGRWYGRIGLWPSDHCLCQRGCRIGAHAFPCQTLGGILVDTDAI